MRRRGAITSVVAVLSLALSTGVSAQVAYVQAADQVGQAWLFRRDGRCHALTAHHVVTAGDVIDLRASSSGAGELARARVIGRWPQEDLALAVVESGALKDCGPLLALPLEVASALRVNASGEFRIVDNQGGIGVRAAAVVEMDDSTLTVRATDNLVKSMSGSVLFIGAVPAGMLTEVPTEGPLTGGGVMLRMDIATRLALERLNAPAAAAPSPRDAPARCGSGTVDPGDIAAKANGGSVVSWTVLPESPEFGPENLLGDGCRAWQIRRPTYPVSVVIDLAGDGPIRLRDVVLDASAAAARFAPEEIEVFTRLGTTGGWTSSGTARFAAAATSVTVALPNVPAAQVMIKIHSGRNAERLALSRVHVRRAGTP
jgi:hypothetical protein